MQSIRFYHSRYVAKLCIYSIEQIVCFPDFVGQSPLHDENFVLIKKVGDVFLLAAIHSLLDEYGEYPLQSSYAIDWNTLHRRLRKGYLKAI